MVRKTAEQLDLQALHRVRERLVSQRTGIINQIRAFLLERGVAVRQGFRFLRAELPRILAAPPEVLSPRMVRIIGGLAEDWRRLDERIDCLSGEITALARQDAGCERLVSVPGVGPIISSAMVAAIGTGEAFSKGRDFAAWLGLVPKQLSTGDRTILGKISKRGNRYLRVLFVQAAWVVLIKPQSWERHGLKRWIEALEPSRIATAYRCSPGSDRSFISPTLGVGLLLISSKISRHCANSSGRRIEGWKPRIGFTNEEPRTDPGPSQAILPLYAALAVSA
jgi:transposase